MKIAIVIIGLVVFFSSCSGCSRSGRIGKNRNSISTTKNSKTSTPVIIKMQKINGVYEIPIEINGITMRFIFDTGAGIISISDVEALFLYKQGTLTNDDIIGNENFSDA